VKLVDIVSPDRVGLVAEAAPIDKRQSLARLAALLTRGLDAPESQVLAILEEREALQSTGIGDGVAVPHGTIEGARGQVGALLLCPGGVDFNAIDDRPARILFGVVGPRQAVEHLKVLARISRILRNSEFRRRLLDARAPEAAYALLRSEDDALG
jgi:PTS system nitrogen regulatory IIA component